MRAWWVGPALTLALAACDSGGSGTAPSPSAGAPTSSAAAAPDLSPEAKGVRDAVQAALDACPCKVEVHAIAYGKGDRPYTADFEGVYDAGSRSAQLVPSETDDELAVRVVAGAVFLTPLPKAGERAPWLELDYSKMPAVAVSEFAPLPLVDPALAFAVAAGTDTAASGRTVRGDHTTYDASFQVAAAVAAAGPSGDLLGRLITGDSGYSDVRIDGEGRLASVSFRTLPVEGQDGAMSVFFTINAFGARGGPVARPANVTNTVDVTTFTG